MARTKQSQEFKEVKALIKADIRAFVALVAPLRLLGLCQKDMLKFFARDDSHQLVLYPRGHQKSMMIAYYVAWRVVNQPEITIIYASATAALSEAQLSIIKQILESPVVTKYFPDLIHKDVGKRNMWRNESIAVDHPRRYKEAVRDPTVKAVGMGANIVGFHADLIVLDDVVVQDNTESKIDREKVKTWYSLLTSVLNPSGTIRAVGTRYHPEDLWGALVDMVEESIDEEGNVTGKVKVYSVMQKEVEQEGIFLWPRQKRKDGKWFGFNIPVLNKIKAQYLDKSKFYSQYYNDPSDPMNKRITNFVYYERDKLLGTRGSWVYGDRKLNVFAAIDFASTLSQRSDYTAIVVVGVSADHNIYILDIERFKTDKISIMQDKLTKLYDKWGWVRLRAEATAAQNLVVEHIKEMNRDQNIYYNVDSVKPTSEKTMRIMSVLEPRYAAAKIYHFKGGLCEELEHELEASKPPHDDMADALASVVEIIVAPSVSRGIKDVVNINTHPRFGGVR